ncbi:B12-binding domain-containing radical SAM protein [Patescibacteria group bacterium]|nr:B12-binding domain-containing radical SAM protein [Patescibacteria group bacterium]MBU4458374.1 B12-binding domain-containing radical SAM protein [Patescibacteria group bacterium]MCG2695871.1 B12-binding domain-containing radical SAM protein [Candidatus Portnoybacteria bacterium]
MKKTILLFMPNPSEDRKRETPLNLIAISVFLEKEGYDIKIFHSFDKNQALMYADKALCVGITAMTGYQIYDGLQFAKLVREKNPNVPIVWGGIHPTIKPIQTVEHPLVDIVVKGQGEDTFTELVHRLNNNESYDDIRGITFKKDGKIIDNPTRPFKSINDYPLFPYHVLGDSIEQYIRKNNYASRSLVYITSSGCVFNCAFCYLSNPAFSRKWDAYPAERVVDELEYLVKTYNIDGVEIRDSNFFVNKQRVLDICSGLLERNIHLSFSTVNGRADQLAGYTDDEWKLLRKAGIRELLIGAESGDKETLNLINKQLSIDMAIECNRKARKYDIDILNSFMTSFPTIPPKKELNNTFELICRIFKVNPLAKTFLFFYTPYPGTSLYELALQQGFKEPKNLEEWGGFGLTSVTTPWTSKSHIGKVLLLKDLFVLKRIISENHLKLKKSWKHLLLKKMGIYALLNWWIDLRFKYKFYFFPIERILSFYQNRKTREEK